MINGIAVLTIAGSDSGGGAGIQADIKTFSAFKVFGTSVITAVTAQNLAAVSAVQPVDTRIVEQQLQAVLEGFPIKAMKTGMLFSSGIISVIADMLCSYRHIPLVIDPVFISTSGSKLLQDDAVECLKTKLFGLATLVTPNIPEAETLAGETIHSFDDMKKIAGKLFSEFNVPVLLKGGHLPGKATDILVDGNGVTIFDSPRVEGVNTHGTGCTLSAAITAGIALGKSLKDSIESAKNYLTRTLRNPTRLSAAVEIINHHTPWDPPF